MEAIMSKFGKYAVIEPKRYHFKDEPSLWWDIKPPTMGDELALTEFMSAGKITRTEDGVVQEGAPTWLDTFFLQVALLFAGTNIPADPDKPVEGGGDPYIKVGTDRNIVMDRIREMPPEMVFEILDAIAECVPGWGPKVKMSGQEESEQS
jgi:hypothetical protein